MMALLPIIELQVDQKYYKFLWLNWEGMDERECKALTIGTVALSLYTPSPSLLLTPKLFLYMEKNDQG